MSYSYVLFKFCEMLGYTQFLECFSLLKGVDKLKKQDEYFSAVCAKLGWPFIPSMDRGMT